MKIEWDNRGDALAARRASGCQARSTGRFCQLRRAIALLSILSLITFTILLWLIADRGFDITDEGYYLLSAAEPDAITASLDYFGYVLYPIREVSFGSLALYRRQA